MAPTLCVSTIKPLNGERELFFTGLPGSRGTILSFRMTEIRLIQPPWILIFCASHAVEAPFATKLANAQPLSATGGREYSLFIATTEHIQQETPTGGHTTEYTGCS